MLLQSLSKEGHSKPLKNLWKDSLRKTRKGEDISQFQHLQRQSIKAKTTSKTCRASRSWTSDKLLCGWEKLWRILGYREHHQPNK